MPGTKPRHIAARQGYEDYQYLPPRWDGVIVLSGAITQAQSDEFREAWIACAGDQSQQDAVLARFGARIDPLPHPRQGTYVGS